MDVEKVFGLDYSRSASLFSSQKGHSEGFTDSDRNRKVELGFIKRQSKGGMLEVVSCNKQRKRINNNKNNNNRIFDGKNVLCVFVRLRYF